ncbi:AMED_5909 family protein [Actinokineospora sp. HUAS TT18]|uniref:AMED_5909 family protein n=1 Tax=Actinokineospora sp. HUAS TT18 TaxID=3447451 RepID=UPI003F523B5F
MASTVEPWRNPDPLPVTLQGAREYLWREPKADAPRDEWIAFHNYRAEVFRHVAQVDSRHRYEAGAEAWLAKDKAVRLGAKGDADAALIT